MRQKAVVSSSNAMPKLCCILCEITMTLKLICSTTRASILPFQIVTISVKFRGGGFLHRPQLTNSFQVKKYRLDKKIFGGRFFFDFNQSRSLRIFSSCGSEFFSPVKINISGIFQPCLPCRRLTPLSSRKITNSFTLSHSPSNSSNVGIFSA